MNGRFFVGFLEVNTTSLITFNGGLLWFQTINEARQRFINPGQAQGAHNIIVLGEHLDDPRPHDIIIECRLA